MTSRSNQAHAALAAVSHRLVRRVASEDSEASAALFHLASRGRAHWTLAEKHRLCRTGPQRCLLTTSRPC